MRLAGGAQILEWPIPQSCGLPFYGTLHTVLPRSVFYGQWAAVKATPAHVHYEIHPIEVLDAESAAKYPWLPTAGVPPAKREAWLDERLAALVQRPVVTLEEVSDRYLPALQ